MKVDRRKLLVGLAAVALPARRASAWRNGSPPSSGFPPIGWNTLPIGGGGFLTGISTSSDGTMAVRTDTYGGYIWNASATSPVNTSGSWQQVVNLNSMPSGTGENGNNTALSTGCWDLQISWSNSSILYMVYSDVTFTYPTNQQVYKSTNKGQTWVATGFTPINLFVDFGSDTANSQFSVKNWGKRLAIDPANPNNVLVGSGNNGLFYTTNGGTSWTNFSSGVIPYAIQNGSSGIYPGYTVDIGNYSGTQYLIAFAWGVGIYLSTNGGSSWSNITSGGPTVVQTWDFDANMGYFYCVDGAGNAWQYTASAGSPAWTKIYSGGNAADISVDPNTANHLVISNGNAELAESTASTPSFGTFTQYGTLTTTGDVPWLSAFTASGGGTYHVRFSPTISKTVFALSNRTFMHTSWTGTLSSSVTPNFQMMARGIEQLVTNAVVVANSGVPLLACWDSGQCWQNNLSAFPSIANFTNYANLVMCAAIDYAKNNSNFIAAMVDTSAYGGSTDYSGYSTDGGQNWSSFGQTPPNAGHGGSLAVSTSNNILFAPAATNGPGTGNQPSFTLNGGASWTLCTLPSDQTTWANWQAYVVGGHQVSADSVTAETLYMVMPDSTNANTNFYVSTNGGLTWTNLGVSISGQTPGNVGVMKCPPGYGAEFWYCGANALYHYYGGNLVKITNLGNGTEGTSTLGFGANPGGGYPSVFVEGYLGSSYPGVFGIYRSDNAATGASPTWNFLTATPNNSFDSIHDISGDPVIPLQYYVTFSGSGSAYYKAA